MLTLLHITTYYTVQSYQSYGKVNVKHIRTCNISIGYMHMQTEMYMCTKIRKNWAQQSSTTL